MLNAKQLHQRLVEKKLNLALAESCTGGQLASQFTSIPDASRYFLGSLVTYSNKMKENLLSVSKESLRVHGAASREVAHEMWIGLMHCCDADLGIAITGVAGPSGGTVEKPVGTVFIAIGQKGKKPRVVEHHFSGNRLEVIDATIQEALKELDLVLETC